MHYPDQHLVYNIYDRSLTMFRVRFRFVAGLDNAPDSEHATHAMRTEHCVSQYSISIASWYVA